MPIVRVENIGNEIDIRQNFERGTAEEGKAFAVVVFAVERIAAEIVLVIEEIEGYALMDVSENAAILLAPRKLYIFRAEKLEFFTEGLGYLRIKGHHDADVVLGRFVHRRGKRADNVAESAG